MRTFLIVVFVFIGFCFGKDEPMYLFYMAPFLGRGGYSSEALTFAVGLYKNTKKEELTFQIVHHADDPNMDLISSFPPSLQLMLREMFRDKRFYPVKNPPTKSKIIVLCHSEPGSWNPPLYHTLECPLSKNRFRFELPEDQIYTIGRTMFETDRFPDGWDIRLNKMDEIWVPTKFHLETFSKFGVQKEKLVVVPESVDLDFYSPNGEKLLKNEEKKTRFLSVFKLEDRKGWKILIEAFIETFVMNDGFEDKTELVILSNEYHLNDNTTTVKKVILEYIKSKYPSLSKEDNKIQKMVQIMSNLPHSDMPKLYRSATVFVLPTRGEGWGRPFSESMASGVPCIATNWSGQTEYMNNENSYLIKIHGLVKVPKDFAFQGHFWADPSVDHLRELMMFVHENPDDVKEKGFEARKTMEEEYSMKKLTEVIMGNLKRIVGNASDVSDEEIEEKNERDEL